MSKLLSDEDNRNTILILSAIGGVAAWVTAERTKKEIAKADRSRRALELARASVFLLFIGSFLLFAHP